MSAALGGPDEAGSVHQLNRGFTFRSAFSLAFADISPIVALYAIFALGLFAAGPAFWWTFPVVLGGQLLVAVTFGELASRWPFAGSVYQWARHVHGTSAGWFAAWAYMWGLTIALSTLSYGAAGFLMEVFGFHNPSRTATTVAALLIILAGTAANIVGRTVLKSMVIASIICEIIGSIGLATWLLLFHRNNPLSTLTQTYGTEGHGSWLFGPGLLAAAYVGWSFLGFESAGSIAEEVEEPERNVPRAIFFSLLFVGLIVMYSAFALILSIPNLGQVMSAQVGDPVSDTITTELGDGVGRVLLVLFVIGFLSSFLAVQAAVSRCVWGSARDNSIPGSRVLDKLAGPESLPVNSILLTGVVAAIFVLMSGSRLYGMLVNFATAGFYIAFGIPVVGAAIARARGRWVPGKFTLGKWGPLVTYAASVWIVFQTVNILWPRDAIGATWYLKWSMLLISGILGVLGVIIFMTRRASIQVPIADRLEAEAEARAHHRTDDSDISGHPVDPRDSGRS